MDRKLELELAGIKVATLRQLEALEVVMKNTTVRQMSKRVAFSDSDTLALVTTKSSKYIGPRKLAGKWLLNFTELIGTVPTFIRIHCSTAATVRFWHKDRQQPQTWAEGMVAANIPLVVKREGWYAVEITPSAYASTMKFYVSSTLPAQILKLGEVEHD